MEEALGGQTLIRLRDFQAEEDAEFRYVSLLFEHVNADHTAFPVVNQATFAGRELTGEASERGATAAHVVVRLPGQGAYDVGKCRCVLEAVPGVSRRMVEWLMCRQLRRVSDADEWDFPDPRETRKGRKGPGRLRYTPRLELHADVGRRAGPDGRPGRVLTSMTFTKRGERQNVAQPTDVRHEDFEAAVEVKIRAEQGPEDPALLHRWAANIRQSYEARGYETRLAFRHVSGDVEKGAVNAALDGATDLLMCSRELVDYGATPKVCVGSIDAEVARSLKAVCARDEIWPPPHPR